MVRVNNRADALTRQLGVLMASQHLLEASGVLLVTVTFSLVGHGPDVLLNVDVRTGRIRLIVLVCLTRDSLQFLESFENRL